MDLLVKKKLVPCTTKTLYDLLKKDKEGVAVTSDWSSCKGGRPRIINKEKKVEIISNMSNAKGRTYGKDEVEGLMEDKMKKMVEDAGHVPLSTVSLSKTTVNNYIAEFAMDPKFSLTQSSIKKTNTRYAAENGIRGSISNLFLVANTHFVPV